MVGPLCLLKVDRVRLIFPRVYVSSAPTSPSEGSIKVGGGYQEVWLGGGKPVGCREFRVREEVRRASRVLARL